jgi:hypothetical protein
MKLRKFICWITGHNWNATHGFREVPVRGANCERCHVLFDPEQIG